MIKVGIYCINKYRTGEYQADMLAKALSTRYNTTRMIGQQVDFMIVINGVYKEDTQHYTDIILDKMSHTPNIFLINEKRAEVPTQAMAVYSQYLNADNHFQLSSVALFDDRFDDVERNYVRFPKHKDFVFWGHAKQGRKKYEDKYIYNVNGNSKLIGEWYEGSIPYKRSLEKLHAELSECRYTVIFGDDHDNNNNMPLRVYEALMCGVIPYFDKDFMESPWAITDHNHIMPTEGDFLGFVNWFLPMGIQQHRFNVVNTLCDIIEKERKMEVKTKSDTAEVLTDRAKIYGSYEDGIKARADIMKSLDTLYAERHGNPMPSQLRVMYTDLTLKLMRSCQDPMHLDSWVDLEGYAKLIKDTMITKGAK